MTDYLKVAELKKRCPNCNKGHLRRVAIDGKPVSYYCIAAPRVKNCALKFEVFRIERLGDGSCEVWGRIVNPDYIKELSSGSFAENLAISEQLERKGINFFLEGELLLESLSEREIAALAGRKNG